MDDQPKPMLNQPIETGMTAGKEFAQNVIGRMDGAHDAHADVNRMLAELPAAEQERLAKFKEQSFARFEELTGLTFDRNTGKCTTEGDICMEGETKEGWAEICQQLGAEKDPKRVEQLWREAGAFLRRAATVKPSTDS